MPADRSNLPAAAFPTETANDRLKRRAALWEANAMVIAVAAHFALLALWPGMSAGVDPAKTGAIHVLPPSEPDVPEAPEQIARPADPVIVEAADPDITIAPMPEAWSRPELLPPPPAAREGDRETYTHIMPSMVPPRVLNTDEVERALVRHYPPTLREAGIGGDVRVLLWLDEKGAITRAEIDESSGREGLDRAALEVVKVMQLTPAYNLNRPTRVIVSLPVKFVAR